LFVFAFNLTWKFQLCLIVLSLSFFYPQRKESSITDTDAFSSAFFPTHTPQPTFNTFDPTLSTELNKLSNQFWTIVNPDKNTMCLQMQPPHLVIYPSASEHSAVKQHIDQLQAHYQAKSLAVRNQYKTAKNPPSLFRLFVLSVLQNTLVFMLGINIPSLLLCLVMICIIIWMTPAWREQWLMPFIKRSFEESVRALIRALPLKFVNLFFFKGASQNHPVVTKSLEYEPDGIQHRGAITVQNLFNQQQYRANVKQVRIKTLSRQHMADIQQLDANARKSLVSCGQDGRILLWDAEKANWMARLDKSNPAYGGVHQAHLNPEYFPNALQVKNSKQKAKKVIPFLKQRLSKALCIKVDQGNKWVAAGYDDGIIRIWNVTTGVLVRELDVNHVPVQVQHEPDQEQGLRRRFSIQSSSSSVSSHGSTDRTLHLQFIGAITEFCHPIVAQAAARCRSNDLEASQNFIVSVHKSGVIREWDILSCECIKTIKTGHTRDITQLRVVDSKAPHRKQGITWVFTASKDGTLRCWERSRPSKPQQFEDYNYDEDVTLSTQWTFLYKIDLSIHGPITSIATELPVGGMGVLVTGSGDGTVKVWNFETGEAVATLSVGRYHKSSLKEHPLGPMRHFSKFSSNALYNSKNSKQFGTDEYLSSGSCNSSVIGLDDSEYGHQHSVSTPSSLSDHTGSINQVTVTRYCEVENGPGVCRACDTCFGNGFLVASSASDNKVHSWRLERADSNHEGSCTLCTKDYHRKQYKHRKSSTAGDDDIVKPTGRRKRSSSVHKNLEPATSPRKVVRHIRSLPKSKNPAPATENEFGIELLDIEQLGGDLHIPLTSSFLGVVDQPAGRGLVFCDKILAGVRRVQNGSSEKMEGEWEAWFASLQYYDPGTDEGNAYIPVETFRLDDQSSGQDNDIVKSKQDAANGQSLLHIRETVLGLFGNTAESTKKPAVNKVDQLKYKHIHAPVSLDGIDDDQDDDDYMTEASEILPFSTIRHVIPLDGSGLACDFGNFIKLVYLDKPSHTEKELMKLSQEGMTTTSTNKIVGKNIGLDKVEEVPDDENCSCEQTGDECSPSTKGKDGCCGGVNKEKNGGKCCGGTKTRNKNQTDRKLLKQQQLSGLNAHNAVNCSIRNNCPRASECAPTVTPISPFGSWL
jgi:WD40 repeat protein